MPPEPQQGSVDVVPQPGLDQAHHQSVPLSAGVIEISPALFFLSFFSPAESGKLTDQVFVEQRPSRSGNSIKSSLRKPMLTEVARRGRCF